MEAMACGLPVIATMHSGIPELVVNGQMGYLVPEKDVDALAAAVEQLLKKHELRYLMGLAGRKYVEDKYDVRKLNESLVQLYRKIIDQ
jgi:colanic acid/amylovoran biosynthesis glycosyltransferase